VRPAVGSRATQGFESALEHLGRELDPILRALDEAAADPWGLDDRAEDLRARQYALHVASERLLELPPALGTEEALQELGAALAIAREETACVAEALEALGRGGAAELVWEWRVALFGVRLALAHANDRSGISSLQPVLQRAYAPVVLLAIGVAVVLGGALVELWPLWVAGLLLVVASALASHRRP